jgi:hypothetical protein
MANTWYTKGLEYTLQTGLGTPVVKVVLLQLTEHTPTFATDTFLSSVPATARIGAPQTLANKTFLNGTLDADDSTFPNVPTETACQAVLAYVELGSDAANRLLFVYDEATSGLPVTPQNNNITVVWPVAGIATLVNQP